VCVFLLLIVVVCQDQEQDQEQDPLARVKLICAGFDAFAPQQIEKLDDQHELLVAAWGRRLDNSLSNNAIDVEDNQEEEERQQHTPPPEDNSDQEAEDPFIYSVNEAEDPAFIYSVNEAARRLIIPGCWRDIERDVDKATFVCTSQIFDAQEGSYNTQLDVSTVPTSDSLLGTDPLPGAIPFCQYLGMQCYISSNTDGKASLMKELIMEPHVYLEPNSSREVFAQNVARTMLKTSRKAVHNALQRSSVNRILTHQYAGKVSATDFLPQWGLGGLAGDSNILFKEWSLVDGAVQQLDIGFNFPAGDVDVLELLGLDLEQLQSSDVFEFNVHPQFLLCGGGCGGIQVKKKTPFFVSEQLDPAYDLGYDPTLNHTQLQFDIMKLTVYQSDARRDFQRQWGEGKTEGEPAGLSGARYIKAKAHHVVQVWDSYKHIPLSGGRVEITAVGIGAEFIRNVCGAGTRRSVLPTSSAECVAWILCTGGSNQPYFNEDGEIVCKNTSK
jgi:hypothetical protein